MTGDMTLASWVDADADRLRDRLGSLLSADGAGTARSDEGVRDACARAIWSLLSEPGDGVAGALVATLGAAEALRVVLDPAASSAGGQAFADGLARWRPRADAAAIDGMFRLALGARLTLLVPGDAAWIGGLDDLGTHAPHALWARAPQHRSPLAGPSVAVVGARAATAYGERVAIDICAELAAHGVAVVSGAAYGIDGAAHRATLHAGGRTVAVLAGGAERSYPAGHADLISRIAAHGGGVVSEAAPGSAPTKWRFLQRNRLIAALADATVVVEAGWRSGSLNTAGHAATLGRPLGAVPGPVTSATSAGCHRLLREYGATCVTSAAEVLELIGAASARAEPLASGARQTDDATRVLDALSTRARRTVEDVAARAGVAPLEAESLLGLLSLEGRAVRREAGWVRVPGGTRPG